MLKRGRLPDLLSFWLSALAGFAAWRFGYLQFGGAGIPPFQAALLILGVFWWDVLLVLGILLILFLPQLAARPSFGGRIARLVSRSQRGSWIAAAFLYGALWLVRIGDQIYYYYSGLHLDLMVLGHAKGTALGLRPGLVPSLMIAGTLLLLALNLFQFRRLARLEAPHVRRALLRLALGTVLPAAALGLWSHSRMSRDVHLHDFASQSSDATVFPETDFLALLIRRRLASGEQEEAALSPLVAGKLRNGFGLSYQPQETFPLLKPRVFETPFPFPKVPMDRPLPNILILSIESLAASLTSIYEPVRFPGVTPHMERFSRQSRRVDGYYNSSTPTLNGWMSTLCSYLPTTHSETWTAGESRFTKLNCLPRILNKQGYHSTFILQVEKDYAEMGQALENAGFTSIIDMDQIGAHLGEKPKSWGFSDHQVFRFLREKLQAGAFPEPFFLFVNTCDTHAPFNMHSDGIPYGDGASLMLNAVHSVDEAFGRFWDAFLQSGYRDNTMVILLGDHTMFPGAEYVAAMRPFENVGKRWYDRIPLAIYHPGYRMAGLSQIPSSQIDLAPTVLHILGIQNQPNHFEGLSLFDGRPRHPNVLGLHEFLFFTSQLSGGTRNDDNFTLAILGDSCVGVAPDTESPLLNRCEYYQYYLWKRAMHTQNRIWP